MLQIVVNRPHTSAPLSETPDIEFALIHAIMSMLSLKSYNLPCLYNEAANDSNTTYALQIVSNANINAMIKQSISNDQTELIRIQQLFCSFLWGMGAAGLNDQVKLHSFNWNLHLIDTSNANNAQRLDHAPFGYYKLIFWS